MEVVSTDSNIDVGKGGSMKGKGNNTVADTGNAVAADLIAKGLTTGQPNGQASNDNNVIIDLDLLDDEPIAAVKKTMPVCTATGGIIESAASTTKQIAKVPVVSIEKNAPAIPIISLSDGEDLGPAMPAPIQKGRRKRNSVGPMGGQAGVENGAPLDDEQFRLKRRKIKVAGAPKMPLTGYVRYMNDRREMLRKEFPLKTAIEHTKIIGEEWHNLNEARKAPYMKAAELDKQRYLTELNAFLKARPDVLAHEMAKDKARKSPGEVPKEKPLREEKTRYSKGEKDSTSQSADPQTQSTLTTSSAAANSTDKNKRKRSPPPVNNNSNTTDQHYNNNQNPSINLTATTTVTSFSAPTPGEIPIYTNEFLEHNKNFDMELRFLRKSKTDVEQQNSVLEKHVENMKFGVEKMSNENDEIAEKNRLLEIYLDKLKAKLAHALSGLAIPTEPNGATMQNIDKYMNDLYKMATTNTHGPASLNKAKDIIRKLDLHIQL